MLMLIGLTWVYMLPNSVQNAFNAVIAVSGLLFGSFYVLTALATVVYYRRRVVSGAWNALILGILPFLAALFLCWVIWPTVKDAPPSEIWSLVGVAVLGVLLMFAARFILKSPFFHIQRESDGQRADRQRANRQRAGSHRR